MRVLLGENLPHKLRGLLLGHHVVTVAYMNWAGVKSGVLLQVAEDAGIDVIITSDQGIPYQQNLAGRNIAIVMLSTPDWNVVRGCAPNIAAAITTTPPGSFTRVHCGPLVRLSKPPMGPALG